MGASLATVLAIAATSSLALASCKESPPRVPLTDAQKAEIQPWIAAAQARIAAQEDRRSAAFTAARTGLVAGERPCAVGFRELGIPDDLRPKPDDDHSQAHLHNLVLDVSRLVFPDGPRRPDGPSSARLRLAIYSIELERDIGFESPEAIVRFLDGTRTKLDDLQPIPYELALIVTRLEKPVRTGEASFQAGLAEGTLYLWSESAGAVICAADLARESSKTVSVTATRTPSGGEVLEHVDAALLGDLVVPAIAHAIAELRTVRAAQPPAPAPAPRRPGAKH